MTRMLTGDVYCECADTGRPILIRLDKPTPLRDVQRTAAKILWPGDDAAIDEVYADVKPGVEGDLSAYVKVIHVKVYGLDGVEVK